MEFIIHHKSHNVICLVKKLLVYAAINTWLLLHMVRDSNTFSWSTHYKSAYSADAFTPVPIIIKRKCQLRHIHTHAKIAVTTIKDLHSHGKFKDISLKKISSTSLFLSTIEKNEKSRKSISSKSKANNDIVNHSSGRITVEQEKFVSSLNPDIYGSMFLTKLRELLEFKNKHGSCAVPKRCKENPSLGNWVNKTRQMYRKYKEGKSSSMTLDRIEVLNKVGFIWSGTISSRTTEAGKKITRSNNKRKNNELIDDDSHHSFIYYVENQVTVQDQLWMNQYNRLKEYWNANEKCYTNLKSSPDYSSVSSWVVRQRREYQKHKLGEKTTMTKDRIQLLDEIEFIWSPRDANWNLRVEELREYKKRWGDCLIPVQYKDNPKLGRWVSTQRKNYKMYKNGNKSRITKEKIKQLSDIGFVWNRWEHSWSDSGSFH